jgi:predicted RNA-binding Zn ribbon-like protein
MHGNARIALMPVVGGTLCTNFVNTVQCRKASTLDDYFGCLHDILTWAVRINLISGDDRQKILNTDTARKYSTQLFDEAIGLRERLFSILIRTINGLVMPTNDEDLKYYKDWLVMAHQQSGIRMCSGQYAYYWDVNSTGFYFILFSVIADAENLLFSDGIRFLRECPRCGWLFLDRTRNRSRKWCSMEYCGNRNKSCSHYQRNKAKQN